ncbi:homeodomain-like DNA binding domain-containing transcription factor [Rhizophagus irregularis DAOM 181602=DAOM 197198]|nr:homeodomain-like DNA binding domain-containing transcription factor [Rhizophagus irregularis DAOM 181602=DAOM 197198]
MFIEKLRDGTHEKISERQYIFGVPQVDWKYHTRPSQYKPPPRPGREVSKSSTSDDEKSPDPAEFVHKKLKLSSPNTVLSTRTKRKTNLVFDDNTLPQSIGSNKKGKQSLYSTPSYSPTLTSSNRRNNKKKSSDLKLSEGSPKTGNYNIPWTDEEQRRLEQEHRSRWLAGLRQQQQKIHNQRIKKLGPKSILPSEKKPRHLRISGLSYLEARPPPTVYMPDDDDESSIKNVMMSVGRLQDNDIQQMCNFITGPVHYGFCCDGCHMDPIIGTRYLFNECDESLEVVLCEECFVEGSFENEYH